MLQWYKYFTDRGLWVFFARWVITALVSIITISFMLKKDPAWEQDNPNFFSIVESIATMYISNVAKIMLKKATHITNVLMLFQHEVVLIFFETISSLFWCLNFENGVYVRSSSEMSNNASFIEVWLFDLRFTIILSTFSMVESCRVRSWNPFWQQYRYLCHCSPYAIQFELQSSVCFTFWYYRLMLVSEEIIYG